MTTALGNPFEIECIIRAKLKRLIEALIKSYPPSDYQSSDYQSIEYECTYGTRYIKLMIVNILTRDGVSKPNGRSVHAFIDKNTGAVYKPASFRAPAKHVRYQLLDDASFENMLKRADWAGRYLYK